MIRFSRVVQFALLLGVLGSLLLTAGCQYTMTPADLLMKPRPLPENAQLAEAIHRFLPNRTKLSLVTEESSNSPILELDAKGDGKKEAFVVFVDEWGNHRVMVLEQGPNGWRKRFTFAESSAYGVDVLRVVDLNRDGKPELLIGWNQFGEPEHILTLYHLDETATDNHPPKPLAELPYDTLGIGDADGDGMPEIGLIVMQRNKLTVTLGLYRYQDSGVTKLATAGLDASVNGYIQLLLGKIAAGKFGVIADAAIGSHSSTSTMLAWNEGKLVQIYPEQSSNDDHVQTNVNTVLSGDGNGDGILDIHMLSEAPGQSEGVPYSDLLWIEEYRQWNGADSFTVVGSRYTDEEGGYALSIPLSWTDFTLRRPEKGSRSDIELDRYNKWTGKRKEALTIRSVTAGSWDDTERELAAADSRYLELGRGSGLVYYAVWRDKLTDNGNGSGSAARGSFPPDEAELKKRFKLLPGT